MSGRGPLIEKGPLRDLSREGVAAAEPPGGLSGANPGTGDDPGPWQAAALEPPWALTARDAGRRMGWPGGAARPPERPLPGRTPA